MAKLMSSMYKTLHSSPRTRKENITNCESDPVMLAFFSFYMRFLIGSLNCALQKSDHRHEPGDAQLNPSTRALT